MYSNKSLILLMSCLLISLPLFAQNFAPQTDPGIAVRSCQTDQIHQEKMQNDPVYRKHFLEKKERMRNRIQQRTTVLCDNPVIIPVAVHYQNATNPDVACLRTLAENQIQILNDDIQGLNSDISIWTGTAAASFPGISNGETCVEFCIATNFHPAGYGISDGDPAVTINQGTSSNYSDWDGYLNIFVRNIGALGFSPLGGNGNGDGVTIDNGAFGSGAGCNGYGFVPGPPFDLGRTLTHEIGHYFDLPHIWGGGCGNDDGVADTPDSQTSYGGCPTIGAASCGSTDMHMNYMDYSNDACMYMFSAGQSTVMETYVDNFLDVIVNNDTVCTGPQPRIQFVSTSNSVNEGTSSCNTAGTQMLSIDLSIGTAPSTDATVTFQTAGTADGQDYSISPSSVTFGAGSMANQTVNITINEDAYVELNEDIQLTYTINPNGGDAIAGNANQSHTININNDDNDPTQGTVTVLDETFNGGSAGWTINDGGSTTDTWELSTQGNSLNGSQFMLVNSDAAGNGSSSDEELISPILNTAGMTDITLEFDQYINVYGPGVVETFEVDVWDGNAWQNVFFWDENDGDIGDWNAPDRPSIDISAHANSAMQVRFRYVAEYDWWWAIDNVLITATANIAIQLDSNSGAGYAEHDLGPFQTVHFYDALTGNIMLTVENTTGHDYGCTFVEVDQPAGNNPGAVASNAPQAEFITNRSYRIIPSTNNPTGAYNLTLYYAEEEINGWAAATGNPASDLEIVKSSTNIGSASILELITPIVGSFASDFTYTASINTGFSGFALGNALTSLPVEMTAFSAKAQEKSILLNWQTATENNNRGFELLRSTSPYSGFSPMAWINGQGTTSEASNYTFDDKDVRANVNYYYQLKQVDDNGQFDLSEIVTAKIGSAPSNFLLTPNPVKQQLQVQFEATNQTGVLRVIDFLGQVVYQQEVEDQLSIELSVEHLPKGVYWLAFINRDQQVFTEKFLKID